MRTSSGKTAALGGDGRAVRVVVEITVFDYMKVDIAELFDGRVDLLIPPERQGMEAPAVRLSHGVSASVNPSGG